MPLIKTVLLFVMLLCCESNAFAQVSRPQKYDYEKYANDPCGDPRVESMMWQVVPGKVISVTDGNNILLSIKNNKRFLVHLVGIDAPTLDQPFGRESQRFLQLMVLGKKVNALVNPGNWSFKTPRPKEATGVVELQRSDAKDVSLSLVGA